MLAMDLCPVCRSPLPPQGRGQHRIYCGRACRARAYRDRQKRVGEVIPSPVVSKDPIDQLVDAVVTAQWLVGNLRRIGRDIGPALGLRCIKVADELDQAMADAFPEACFRAQTANDRAMARLMALAAEHPLPGDEELERGT